jgi:hypothetical protein
LTLLSNTSGWVVPALTRRCRTTPTPARSRILVTLERRDRVQIVIYADHRVVAAGQ